MKGLACVKKVPESGEQQEVQECHRKSKDKKSTIYHNSTKKLVGVVSRLGIKKW